MQAQAPTIELTTAPTPLEVFEIAVLRGFADALRKLTTPATRSTDERKDEDAKEVPHE